MLVGVAQGTGKATVLLGGHSGTRTGLRVPRKTSPPSVSIARAYEDLGETVCGDTLPQ